MKEILITIDGPSGAGKTSISKNIAQILSYRYLDSGALYRAIAIASLQSKTDIEDELELKTLCASTTIELKKNHKDQAVFLNGTDITDKIRTPQISMHASAISAKPYIRAFLLDLQRSIGTNKGVVAEGRDMGTVVFPHADIKFFLTASAEIRAMRRYEQIKHITKDSYEIILSDLNKRDQNDASRSIAPLRAAEDAVMIDSSQMSQKKAIETILEHIQQKI